MPVITLSNGKSFESEEGESILSAAQKGQVSIPYSCRSGRCNSCKCRVISGDSFALHSELGLAEGEKAAGWILSCVREATSDLVIEAEDLGDLVLPPAKTLPTRVAALERVSPDVMKVILRLPPTSDFSFHPGQYIEVIGNGGLRRSYSLANASAAGKQLELHIRCVPNGALSGYWFGSAKANDLLRLNGPLGTFVLRNVADLDLVFLATGTGIAPVQSILQGLAAMAQEERPRSVTVYWGGRTPADLYTDIAGIGLLDRFVPVLSRADDAWSGARGHVQDVFLSRGPDLSRTVVYACGSEVMIGSAREALMAAGLSERRFMSDAFVCAEPSEFHVKEK